MGLLSKANLLDTNQEKTSGLAFSNFVRKYNIKCCALFEKVNDNYIITNSIGFDFNSIIKSKSTIDFWNGLNESSDLSIFKQFFSSELSEKIKTINVKKINSEKILMLCNSIITESIKSDLQSLTAENSICEYENITNKNVQFSKIELKINNVDTTFISSISEEIFNRLINFYFKEIKILKNMNTIKLMVPVNETFESQLFNKHLLLNFSDIFQNPTEYIIIESCSAENYNTLVDFIKAE